MNLSGKEIKEIIKKDDNLTQAELAKLCTVSKSTVSYWMNEKRPIPVDKISIVLEYINVVNSKLTSEQKISEVNNNLKYEEIRKDLIDQLEKKNKYGTHYEDLVDHAVYLFTLKDELQEDIKINGLRISMATGNGHMKEVDNASIRHLNQVSSQLLRVLKDFGLDTPDTESDDYDADDYT